MVTQLSLNIVSYIASAGVVNPMNTGPLFVTVEFKPFKFLRFQGGGHLDHLTWTIDMYIALGQDWQPQVSFFSSTLT